MISRPFWLNRIENAWREAPICWLAGVRRAGKTTLAKSLGEERMDYVNCDLPVTRDRIVDPELFYRNCTRPVVIFDEVHQLQDPSMVLKIGADLFPHLKIMATGSSILAASRKFQDTLTGRKRLVRLPPVLWEHLVLEYLQAHLPDRTIQYWRDADGREIDFILVRKRDEVDAIECKWSPDHFNADALKIFRGFYGRGVNYLVCPVPAPGYRKRISGMEIRVCNPDGLLG